MEEPMLRWTTLAVALALITMPCWPSLAAQAPPSGHPPDSPRLTLGPTVLESLGGAKVDAEEGRLLVPENRAHPTGRTVELVFLRVKSTAAHPGPPILFLSGGPGDSGIETARGPGFDLFMALREVGDVII